jgi:AsmA protein
LFDWRVLQGPSVKGQLQIDTLKTGQLVLNDLKTGITLAKGRLDVSPHSARLLGGSMQGSLTLQAQGEQVLLKESFRDIQVAQLLKATGSPDRLTGQGQLSLDLAMTGHTAETMKRSLGGTAQLRLANGAIKGVDVNAILRAARAALGQSQPQSGTTAGQTDFTELTASATIKQGVLTNPDLVLKAPLFGLKGSGTVNLPESRVDYRAQITLVSGTQTQDSDKLAALRDVAIPVRISGSLDKPSYQIDMAALALELAKGRATDTLRGPIDQLLGPGATDRLKGLFGR